jgi:hypothetical protein
MNSGAAQQIAIHNEAASADVPTNNTFAKHGQSDRRADRDMVRICMTLKA